MVNKGSVLIVSFILCLLLDWTMETFCPPSLLGGTDVQWPPLEGSTSSTCLVSAAESLPSSISEPSPDSAEHDSSSDSSLFPNKLPSFLHTSIRGALSLWSRNFPRQCIAVVGQLLLRTGSLCQLGRPPIIFCKSSLGPAAQVIWSQVVRPVSRQSSSVLLKHSTDSELQP